MKKPDPVEQPLTGLPSSKMKRGVLPLPPNSRPFLRIDPTLWWPNGGPLSARVHDWYQFGFDVIAWVAQWKDQNIGPRIPPVSGLLR